MCVCSAQGTGEKYVLKKFSRCIYIVEEDRANIWRKFWETLARFLFILEGMLCLG